MSFEVNLFQLITLIVYCTIACGVYYAPNWKLKTAFVVLGIVVVALNPFRFTVPTVSSVENSFTSSKASLPARVDAPARESRSGFRGSQGPTRCDLPNISTQLS